MPQRMNVGSLLSIAALREPEKVAIIWKDSQWTYRELNARVNSFANALREMGIQKGDRVSILAFNCNQMAESILGIYKIGAVAVPINATLTIDEAIFQIDDSDSKFLIFDEYHIDHANKAKEKCTTLSSSILIGSSLESNNNFEKILDQYKTEQNMEVEVDRDDLAWLFYTSGTTGKPKGAMLTHGNLIEMTVGVLADVCPANKSSVCLHIGLLSHGAWAVFLPILAKAGTNLIFPKHNFDLELMFKLIGKHRVSSMFMVPTMIKMIIDSPYIDQYDISSIETIVYGGSPMYVEDLTKALEKIGPVFVQIYGQGETPMTGTYLPKGDHKLGSTDELKRLGSAGFPRTGIELKIVDENDETVKMGEKGEICIRGDSMMKGYWKQEKATEKTLQGGWVHTGDIGYFDEHGYLYITDRVKDMYISGGYNVYPREVEEIILQHPAVNQVCVIGIPDVKWGEAGKALIVLENGCFATEEEILQFCKNRMAGYKKPKSIEFLNEFPISGYGKVLKRELREKYWQAESRRVR